MVVLRAHRLIAMSGLAVAAATAAIADPLTPTVDFTRAEPGEAWSAGAATSRHPVNRNSFSHSSDNMGFERELDFKVGNGIFKRVWVTAPASTDSADGLGPLYNARSCQRCHLKDGRGHPPNGNWPEDNAISMFLRISIPPQTDDDVTALAEHRKSVIGDPAYGTQIQDFAIPGLPAEGRMHITYSDKIVTFADGETVTLRRPAYKVTDLGYGPLHPDAMLSPRVAPPMIGLGLLEAIPAEEILAGADPDDRDNDGISGRANQVWDAANGTVALGRFGWKAGNPTVRQQSAGAFAGDIGISTPENPAHWGDCTDAQTLCRDAPHGASQRHQNAETSTEMLDLVTFYSRNLAVPKRRNVDEPDVLRGKALFYQSGCTSCHRPKFKTADLPDRPEQSGQLIWPYTDLLLHDMGDGLADNRPEGVANGREWRTAPLWGIGLTEIVNGHTYFLHDGRARNLMEAILWHGGEAEAAKNEVLMMSKQERTQLLTFLNSL